MENHYCSCKLMRSVSGESLLQLWADTGVGATQMEGWLNAYREGGWLPSWSAPGDRGAMTGNMQVALLEHLLCTH